MRDGVARELDPGGVWLRGAGLAVVAIAVFALLPTPRIQAQSPPTTPTVLPSFDVASIKPDHLDGHHTRVSSDANSLMASGLTLKRLMELAYNVKDFQISGGPGWVDSETYAVQAKIDDAVVEELRKLPPRERYEQFRLRVQSLLADRFKLKVSHSSKELSIYALVLTKGGPKFSPASGDAQNLSTNNGNLTARAETISHFADWLSGLVGRKVVDKTGLQEKYDFAMTFTRRQDLTAPVPADASQAAPSPDSGPSIFTALQEQLGLKLESQKGPVETLIIESVEKPSEN
jgi:bla regulator protein BlaR1